MSNATFTRDEEVHQIVVKKHFEAPRERVWAAWTEADRLDQWWAPKPWRAITKTFNFVPGGNWHYCMKSPEEETSWGQMTYHEITPQSQFTATDVFCDANGVTNADFGATDWSVVLLDAENGTDLIVTLTFASAADMQKIIELGFEEGFTMGLSNLEDLLKKED